MWYVQTVFYSTCAPPTPLLWYWTPGCLFFLLLFNLCNFVYNTGMYKHFNICTFIGMKKRWLSEDRGIQQGGSIAQLGCWLKIDPDRSVGLHDSGWFPTERQNGTFGQILTSSDWSIFNPPSPQTLAGDLIEILGWKLTQLFSTVDQSGIFLDWPGGPISGVDYPWESHQTPLNHQRGKTCLTAQGRWRYVFYPYLGVWITIA